MFKDKGHLIDLVQSAQLAVEFTQGMDLEAFEEDLKTQAAVMQKIMVMGEASKRISSEFKASHPQIPWREIAGMRDKLIHDYQKVNFQTVWLTVQYSIPQLLIQIHSLNVLTKEDL